MRNILLIGLILIASLVLSGCSTHIPQAYPVIPCNKEAPRHLEIIVKYNQDAIETAKLMQDKNWTNVGYKLPDYSNARVWGDCNIY